MCRAQQKQAECRTVQERHHLVRGETRELANGLFFSIPTVCHQRNPDPPGSDVKWKGGDKSPVEVPFHVVQVVASTTKL
jgi:hypothetical protein